MASLPVCSVAERTPSIEEVRRILNRKKKPLGENGQRAVNTNVIVNALGRTCVVADGNSEAARTPLHGIVCDLEPVVATCDLDDTSTTCDSRSASEMQWLCQQVGALKHELESQKQESIMEVGVQSAKHLVYLETEFVNKAEVSQLKFELDGQKQELRAETDCLRQELKLSTQSAKKNAHSDAEFASKTEIAGLQCKLDSQKQDFREEIVNLRHELTLSMQSAKKNAHSEAEFASKTENAGLQCKLEFQEQEFREEIVNLRHELALSMESFKTELQSEVDLAKQKQAADLQRLETRCSAQVVQPSHMIADLASKDQLRKLQDDLQTVSTQLKDNVECVLQKVSEMDSSVQQSSTGYTMCSSQHTEMLQTFTNLTTQSNVFHARLANVEQSVHNSFLEQLKKDADLIPESIRESDDSPNSLQERKPFQVRPCGLYSGQKSHDLRQEAFNTVSHAPVQITSSKLLRETKPRCPSPGTSCASPSRGNTNRSQSLDMPHPFMSSSRRVSARSLSPILDRLDARLPLTIVENPDRVECNPSNAVSWSPNQRTASPDQETESLDLESSPSSSPERGGGTLINTPRSSLHSLPSEAELIRMEEVLSQTEAAEDMTTPSVVSYPSGMGPSASHVSSRPRPRVFSSEAEVSCPLVVQSPRLPFDLATRRPLCVRSGATTPRLPSWTHRPGSTPQITRPDANSGAGSEAQSGSVDVDSSPLSSRGPSSISTGAANSVRQVQKQLQTRLESTKLEAHVVTPQPMSARVNGVLRSQSQPDVPPATAASPGCCLSSSQQTASNPGHVRAQRMLGLSK